jgi:hypothetical protein
MFIYVLYVGIVRRREVCEVVFCEDHNVEFSGFEPSSPHRLKVLK